MYEIATLKTKKLPELQEIAKKIGIKRIASLKKLDLIYQIVDFIASKPDDELKTSPPIDAVKQNVDPTKKVPLKTLPVSKSRPQSQNDNKQGVQKNHNNNKHKNSVFYFPNTPFGPVQGFRSSNSSRPPSRPPHRTKMSVDCSG